jgi:hypothetical protein
MIAKDKATQVAVQFERDARLAVVDGELAAAAVTRNAADMHKRVTGKELEFVSTRAYMQQFLEAKGTKSTEATIRSYDKTVRYFLAHLGAKANASIQKVIEMRMNLQTCVCSCHLQHTSISFRSTPHQVGQQSEVLLHAWKHFNVYYAASE